MRLLCGDFIRLKWILVIPLRLEPRTLPIKNRDALPTELRRRGVKKDYNRELPFEIKSSMYFLDFIFLMYDSRCFASNNVGYSSVYFNSQGIPKRVNFEWPILCSYNLLLISMQAPI